MEVGTPVVGALRRLAALAYGFVERWVCSRAYEVSTVYHDHRESIEARPRPLGDHVGYILLCDEYLQGSRQQAPMIEVRALGGTKLSKVVLSVCARNQKVSYHDEVVFREVDRRRHRAALRIPFRRPRVERNAVYTPYDTTCVKLIEVLDDEGHSLLPHWQVADTTHPLDRLEVALGEGQDFVEKWGRVFHLEFMDMSIKEELVRVSAWRWHQSPPLRWLTGWLKYRCIGRTLFWLKNFRHAKGLTRELEQHIAEYNEYAARRDEAERQRDEEGAREPA
jgi:hypothetical protein